MIVLQNIKMPINSGVDELKFKVLKMAKINKNDLKHFKIIKKSIDARDKNNIFYVYSVEVSSKVEKEIEREYKKPLKKADILVVGAGPAGLFCALDLLRYGHNVTLIERGKKVEERKASVDGFINTRILDEESNIQFGEGGAGTFSDGKLNTNVNSVYVKEVIKDFVNFGAPSEVGYLSKPHIGSDNLPKVVKNIREQIISLGGRVLFNTKLTDVKIKDGKVVSVTINDRCESFDDVVLCVGHSARDVYEMLDKNGVFMESKEFAVGVRIEHLNKDINLSQYGEKYKDYKNLPSADYKLTSSYNGRGAFTFCMCPGGYVMPSSSTKNTVVVNGMSNFLRDGENSNSAVVVQVKKSDFESGVFGGLNFLKNLEQKAFLLGGEDYSAPAQLVGDYLLNKVSSGFYGVKPTYQMGVKFVNLSLLLPNFVDETLKFAIKDMAKRIKCFDSYDAVLTGIESRTSSPVRVTRTELGSSVSATNLYPCGEGCGYAGGIASAGADGKKIAQKINEKYS